METLNNPLEKVMPQQGLPSGTPQNKSKNLNLLVNPSDSVIENGVNALDLVGSQPMSEESFIKAIAYLQQSYGIDYPKEKFSILFDLIRDEKWTEERFQRTLKWFLKTKYNQAWTVADWFQYNIKVYPFQWVRNYCNKNGIREVDYIKTLDCYLVDGIRVYREKDGAELPLQKV